MKTCHKSAIKGSKECSETLLPYFEEAPVCVYEIKVC